MAGHVDVVHKRPLCTHRFPQSMCVTAQMCRTCADHRNTENARISEWDFLGRQKIQREKREAITLLEYKYL